MRTGITLKVIREEVQIESGHSTESGHNLQMKSRIDKIINRTQRLMDMENDWPAVDHFEDVAITANTSIFNIPTEIDTTHIDTAWVMQGIEWWPVEYGITQGDRGLYSATDRSEPILKWRLIPPGNAQFEIWPVPPSATTMRFEGQKKLTTMVAETDTCLFDADVLVMRVAGQILARERKDDAALLIKQAFEMTNIILKRQGGAKREDFNMGGDRTKARLRPGIDYIAPGG